MKKLCMTLAATLCALATIPASATWSWVTEGTKATDGSWTLTLAEDEIDGVTGLKVTGQTTNVSANASTDLDLSTFEYDLGRKIIRFNNIFRASKTYDPPITSVVAPTVLRVEAYCFENNKKLTNAQFVAATYLGNNAFQQSALKSVSFSKDITYIGGGCFYQCPITIENPNWPHLKTLGASAFLSGAKVSGDVNVPELTTLTTALSGLATLKSFNAPSATNIVGGAFYKCSGLTNITIMGSATALANAKDNFKYTNASKIINWLGTEAPVTMAQYALYDQQSSIFRVYVNAPDTATVLAWQSHCSATAEQIADDETYAGHKGFNGYDAVKDKLIGYIGTCATNNKGVVSAKFTAANLGPCWIVNTAEVQEEEKYQATITPPEHSAVEKVTSGGYLVQPRIGGKYEILAKATLAITYRADEGYQFDGGLSVYTQENVPAAEAIGPEACEKDVVEIARPTITLSASGLAAHHIASVALSISEPYQCVTNGDDIVYTVYSGVAFTLTYAAEDSEAARWRFEGGAKTLKSTYANGITEATVIAADKLPTTEKIVCRWTYQNNVVSDGNWSFPAAIVTIDGVTGIRILRATTGNGALDLTNFREESSAAYDIISMSQEIPTGGVSFNPKPTRIVAPAILRFEQMSQRANTSLAEVIAPNAVYVHYATFSGCSNLTNVLLSANVKEIGQEAFKSCAKLASIGTTVWPELTTLSSSAFSCTGLSGDIVVPEVTYLSRVFEATKITSLYAPKCTVFEHAVVSQCFSLTNVVIAGSKSCYCTETYHGAMSNIGKVETMRYLSEVAPTNMPESSISTAKADLPMMLYVNLKGATSRVGWEKLCTVTADDIKTNAVYQTIPNYNTVLKQGLVGYIGSVKTDIKGAFVRVGSVNGNGPCWVVDGDWRAPGMMFIIK